MDANYDGSARLKITEIFHSIQGESTHSGKRFSFIRLTGCPLRCTYCDTTYSYTGGNWHTVDELVAAVAAHNTKWICVTGGEPLAQKKCIELVKALSAQGKNITIETDGEEDVSAYAPYASLILDIKTPGSGEKAVKAFENLKHLTAKDEVKFVITNKDDYEWSKNIVSEYKITERATVLFSPIYGQLDLKDVATWILRDGLDVRLQTQLHKLIWGTDSKGV